VSPQTTPSASSPAPPLRRTTHGNAAIPHDLVDSAFSARLGGRWPEHRPPAQQIMRFVPTCVIAQLWSGAAQFLKVLWRPFSFSVCC
jgi:hypothetical protein